jgi:hypothetical protein
MRRREVEVRLDGIAASVAAAAAPLVEPLLHIRKVSFAVDGGVVVGHRDFESLGRRVRGRLVFPAKLAATRVAPALHLRGYQVRLIRPPGCGVPRPDPDALMAAPAPLAALFAHSPATLGGLIRDRRRADLDALLVGLLRLYPRTRAVVAVANRRQIADHVGRLAAAGLGRPVVTVPQLCRGWWGAGPKVLVASPYFFDHCQPEDFDLAVVPDVGALRGLDLRLPSDGVIRAGRGYRLARHWHVPAFGLVPAGLSLAVTEVRRLYALFGQTLGRVDSHGCRNTTRTAARWTNAR